jgi:hypothetical protein
MADSRHFDDDELVLRNRMAGVVTDVILSLEKVMDSNLLLLTERHWAEDGHKMLLALHDSLEKE